MRMKTETFSEFDSEHRLIKITQKVNRNGEEQILSCLPLREEIIKKVIKKNLGINLMF